MGPQTGEFKSHNNFYGFRIPRDGKLLGFQINHIQNPNHGQFYAFVFNKTGSSEELRFTYPIVTSIGTNQADVPDMESNSYASGNTKFVPERFIDVKKDGYLFIAQDLSYRPTQTGDNVDAWNNYWRTRLNLGDIGDNQQVNNIPRFTAATGQFHATAYLRYD